jgi:hypothetical protein
MLFIECIAIILRRNIRRIGPGKRQNRLSGGFMTTSWQPHARRRQFGGGSWLHSARRGPLDRQIVTQSSAARICTAVGCADICNAMHARRNSKPDPWFRRRSQKRVASRGATATVIELHNASLKRGFIA